MSYLQPAFDLAKRSATTGELPPPSKPAVEVAKLIDVSKCIGCKACQVACSEYNDLRQDIEENVGVYDNPHDLSPNTWTRGSTPSRMCRSRDLWPTKTAGRAGVLTPCTGPRKSLLAIHPIISPASIKIHHRCLKRTARGLCSSAIAAAFFANAKVELGEGP